MDNVVPISLLLPPVVGKYPFLSQEIEQPWEFLVGWALSILNFSNIFWTYTDWCTKIPE
jgi:hypothetical protein